MLGGEIDPTEEAAVGLDVIDALGRFRIDVAFVGAGGLSPTATSPTTPAPAAEHARAHARRREPRLFPARPDEVRPPDADPHRRAPSAPALILDVAPPPRMAERLQHRGVEVVVASGTDE